MAAPIIISTGKHTYTVDTHINNMIGNGGFGFVYGGFDEWNSKIAAKCVREKFNFANIAKEASRLLTLNHRNTVEVYDVKNEVTMVWIFMEYCSNGDLQDFVKRKRLTLDQKLDLMIQIATGVAYLHGKNVVHRDTKPPNILMSGNTAKLADFDLSKFLDPEVETSVMTSNVGTLAFKAPKFFFRDAEAKIHYHRNVDIFATALTFLAMLQYKEGARYVLPCIETVANDGIHIISIGQVLAQRLQSIVNSKTARKRSYGEYELALVVGIVAGVISGGLVYLGTMALTAVTVANAAFGSGIAGGVIGLAAGGATLYFMKGSEYVEFSDSPFINTDNDNIDRTKSKRSELRKLIQSMTCVEPKNRPSAQLVIEQLRVIKDL